MRNCLWSSYNRLSSVYSTRSINIAAPFVSVRRRQQEQVVLHNGEGPAGAQETNGTSWLFPWKARSAAQGGETFDTLMHVHASVHVRRTLYAKRGKGASAARKPLLSPLPLARSLPPATAADGDEGNASRKKPSSSTGANCLICTGLTRFVLRSMDLVPTHGISSSSSAAVASCRLVEFCTICASRC
jgi:hypothetical protein